MLGEDVVIDTMTEVAMRDRVPAVKQTASVLYHGDAGFMLSEGDEGKYGKAIEDAHGNKHVFYYIPSGTYSVTNKSLMSMVYIAAGDPFVNNEGYIDINTVGTEEFTAFDERHEITVKDGEYIALSFGAKIVFEPTQQ